MGRETHDEGDCSKAVQNHDLDEPKFLQPLQSSRRIRFVIASLPFCRLLRLVEAPAVDRMVLLVPC